MGSKYKTVNFLYNYVYVANIDAYKLVVFSCILTPDSIGLVCLEFPVGPPMPNMS